MHPSRDEEVIRSWLGWLSATLTTGNDNTSTTFSGALSGSGGLTKIGSGTLKLSGSNAAARLLGRSALQLI